MFRVGGGGRSLGALEKRAQTSKRAHKRYKKLRNALKTAQNLSEGPIFNISVPQVPPRGQEMKFMGSEGDLSAHVPRFLQPS